MKLFILTFLLSPAVFALDASYTVPVESSTATNKTHAELTTLADGSVTLTYALPEDIVGPAQSSIQMTLAGKFKTPAGTSYKFVDSVGWSICNEHDNTLVCTSEYDHLHADSHVDDFLRAKFAGDPATLALKLATFASFHNDPVGVLVINCGPTGCGIY